jgi:hypothetical protein
MSSGAAQMGTREGFGTLRVDPVHAGQMGDTSGQKHVLETLVTINPKIMSLVNQYQIDVRDLVSNAVKRSIV